MRFRERIARFFYGRYGIDGLYYGLLVAIVVLWILRVILSDSMAVSILIYIVEVILLFWMLYRCLSRNIAARRRENEVFCSFFRKIKNFFILQKIKFGISKVTAIKNVPTAKQRFGYPKGKEPTLWSVRAAPSGLTSRRGFEVKVEYEKLYA